MQAQRQLRQHFSVREFSARSVPPSIVAAWSALEARALETSAYLSPHFVLPAVRHLDPDAEVLVFVVQASDDDPSAPRVLGVAVCKVVRGTRAFPVPHLVAYRSKHSYLTGLLLDDDCAEEVLTALFRELGKQRWRWHGLEFEVTWGDGPLHATIRRVAAQMGLGRQEWSPRQRAVVDSVGDRDSLEQKIAEQSHGLRRRVRRLSEMGRVDWSLVRCGGIPQESLQAFLDLEHQGWKGANGSALLARRESETFFREMVAGFSTDERAIFLELKLDGIVVASSCQFVSGAYGSAFKIGWRPDLAKVSPGVQVEIELMRRMCSDPACTDIRFWGSGAEEGSYVEKLWPGRRPLVAMAVSFSAMAQSLLGIVQTVRNLRRQYRDRIESTPASSSRGAVRPSAPTPSAGTDAAVVRGGRRVPGAGGVGLGPG